MRKIISTDAAPAAIGPYSQATIIDGKIITSGQIPIDPATGSIESDTIEGQTMQALENLKAVLTAGGSSMDKVIKTTVFMKDMNDFAKMNEVYGTFFKANSYPSRSAVQVAKLPKDSLLEIEAIAYI